MDLSQIISNDAFYWGVFILLLLTVNIILFIKQSDTYLTSHMSNKIVARILVFAVILFITFFVGADKPVYKEKFIDVCRFGFVTTDYLGWSWLTYCLSFITDSYIIYFFILAFIYVIGNFAFCKYNTRNYLLLFIAVISFMGFYAYGVNTIKSGLGLSLFLVSLCNFDKKKYVALLFVFLAYEIHHSTLIPIIAFTIAFYIRRTKYYYLMWITCIGLSLIFGSYFQLYIGSYLGADDRYGSYLISESSERYQVGFRYDFLLYSTVPIIWGYLVEKWGYANERWGWYFRSYIMANSIWVLIISMPFTDRVAYLSWFLIPYILLIPILDNNVKIPNRKLYLFLSFFIFGGFSLYQHLFR